MMPRPLSSTALLIATLGSIIFIGAACTRSGTDGGIFKSTDSGLSWLQKSTFEQSNNQQGTIANYDITELTIDPTNASRLYAGTWNNGAIISEDGGEHWKAFFLNHGTVRSILVSPRDARILYAALPDEVLRSDDGGSNWKQILPVSGVKNSVQSMTLGGNNGTIVYVGFLNGDLLRTETKGESWTRIHGFENRIERVLANQNDGNIVYVATTRNGLWKSADGGRSWATFSDHSAWTDADGIRSYRAMTLDPTTFDGLIYGSAFGMLRTRDGGVTWSSIRGLESPGTFSVSAIAIDPRDQNILIYGTRAAIFRTTNGGTSWKTIAHDSTRAPVSIVYNRTNPSIIYLGLAK